MSWFKDAHAWPKLLFSGEGRSKLKTDIKTGKGVASMGSPLHGLTAGYKAHNLMSPTVHMNDRVHDLRKNGSDGHINRSRDDMHHYTQDAFKENWPVIAGFGAGAAAGGGAGAAAGGGAAGGAATAAPVAGGVGAGAGAGVGAGLGGIETVTVTGSAGSALPGLMGAGAGAGAGAATSTGNTDGTSWKDYLQKGMGGKQQQQQQQGPAKNPWLEMLLKEQEERRQAELNKQALAQVLATQQRRAVV